MYPSAEEDEQHFDVCCPSLHHASDFYLEERTRMTRGPENRPRSWAKERDLFKSLFRLSASLHCWQKGQRKVVPRCRAGHSSSFSTLDSSPVSLSLFFCLPHYCLFLLVMLIILQPTVHACIYHAFLKSYFSCMANVSSRFYLMHYVFGSGQNRQTLFSWILFRHVWEVTRFREFWHQCPFLCAEEQFHEFKSPDHVSDLTMYQKSDLCHSRINRNGFDSLVLWT